MQKFSLDAMAREHLERAAAGTTHRSSVTVFGGHEHALRQTLIALVAGASMAEHDSPGEATLFVLRGRVRLHAGEDTWEGRTGDLLVIPPTRHSVDALEDSVTLLTVTK
ncbi:MAG TPA: cupin domain-containing protein [Pseudonocardiaceae bacterium]|nr:cupin domain-containing protein [Pseudonocardiaceae bacterium]